MSAPSSLSGGRVRSLEYQERDKAIGRRLRDIRIMAGITQETAAKAIGVSFGIISKYEKGEIRISLDYVYYLSKATGVPIGYFFGESGADIVYVPGSHVVVSSDEVEAMARAFVRIPHTAVRRAVLTLVRRIAESAGERFDPDSVSTDQQDLD